MKLSDIKKGYSVFAVSISGVKFSGKIKSVGSKFFVVDRGEDYDNMKFEIETGINTPSGLFTVYKSESHYTELLAERKRIQDINDAMVWAFENRSDLSEADMLRVIDLLS